MKSIEFLQKNGISFEEIVLEREPTSARDIVELFHCELDQVVKTLLFCGDRDVLICVPGDKRVDINKLKDFVGAEKLRIANPTEVMEKTGYKIGGVCPFLVEDSGLVKIIDNSCFNKEVINIGSGKPEIGLQINNSSDLKKIWDGNYGDIIES